MRKLKYFIAVVILFITIGFAAINYTLSIDGDTELTGDLSDFKVYYSELKINGVDSPEAIISDTELYVSGVIDTVGDTYTVDYDITNSSKLFDANITMNCTGASDYLSVTNNFDTTNALNALSTRSGTLVFTKIKTIASTDSINFNVSCKFVASPVEREVIGSGSIVSPLNPYYIGREVSIGAEKFNIINEDEDTITMLAQLTIGLDFKQSLVRFFPIFSGDEGWEYSPGPKEIDVQTWGSRSKEILNNYVAYLKELTGDQTVLGDFITLKQLEALGCIIADDYTYNTDEYCGDSLYKDWLIIDRFWWTKSASSEQSHKIWAVGGNGYMQPLAYDCGESSVRPVVTISKEVAEQLLRVYPIGKEISIGTEKFNVISDNGTSISMLAQYNLGTDYRQTSELNEVVFSEQSGWEYTPSPKEVDVQLWSTNPKIYIDKYVDFLRIMSNDDYISGDLITVNELINLGCMMLNNYSSIGSCSNSVHNDWLINEQSWWTSSAFSNDSSSVYFVNSTHNIYYISFERSAGIRPVITISKKTLNNLPEQIGENINDIIFAQSYNVGDEVRIKDEKFNVISYDGDTITMLAKYMLYTNYKQLSAPNPVPFADSITWEYAPGPKEIDLEQITGDVSDYLNEYENYLREVSGYTNISASLITLEQLDSLGCSVSSDYSDGSYSCENSLYPEWLPPCASFWTRSAVSDLEGYVWVVGVDKTVTGYDGGNADHFSIRPLITISRSDLDNLSN